MTDNSREKAVNIGRLVRHEESQEFLEVLKHQRKAFMLNDAMMLVRGKGVATIIRQRFPPKNRFHVVEVTLPTNVLDFPSASCGLDT